MLYHLHNERGESYPDVDNLILLSNIFSISIDRLLKNDNCMEILSAKNCLEYNQIISFLLVAKKSTYAGNGTELIKSSRPNSHDFLYKEGEYEYIDTYLGAERFIGEEAIFYKNQPIWAMNYAGIEMSENFSSEFLKKALSKVTKDRPYRGPQIFEEGEFLYFCDYTGDFESFHGHEEIYCRKEKVYQCTFHGGIVK